MARRRGHTLNISDNIKKILRVFVNHPDTKFLVIDLHRYTKLPPNTVSTNVKRLHYYGLLDDQRDDPGVAQRHHYYWLPKKHVSLAMDVLTRRKELTTETIGKFGVKPAKPVKP